MYKRFLSFIILAIIVTLAACGGNDANEANDDDLDELVPLEVEFDPSETAEVGETIELNAIVTYGDDPVDDADYVDFEYWEGEDKDNSVTIDSTNNKDGTYTAEVSFDEDGVYSIYAHTQAKDLHTMPKRMIAVGDAEIPDEDGDDHAHVEGFDMHFMKPENADVDKDIELMVHLEMNDEPFENAEVRYEIKQNDEAIDWIDAEETTAGEYISTHTFTEAGTYTVQIHVEDDEGLHEHEEHEFEISE